MSASRRIYIGRLSDYVPESEIYDRFSDFGRVLSVDLKRGYGFVEFDDPRDADDAIYHMDGRRLDGKAITCEFARSRGRSFERGPPRSRPPPQRTPYRVRFDNLPRKMSWQDLKDHIRPVAEASYAEIRPEKECSTGVVHFPTRDDVLRVVEKFDRTDLYGDLIYVEEEPSSRPPSPRSQERSLSPRRRSSLSSERGRKQSHSPSRERYSPSRSPSPSGDVGHKRSPLPESELAEERETKIQKLDHSPEQE